MNKILFLIALELGSTSGKFKLLLSFHLFVKLVYNTKILSILCLILLKCQFYLTHREQKNEKKGSWKKPINSTHTRLNFIYDKIILPIYNDKYAYRQRVQF